MYEKFVPENWEQSFYYISLYIQIDFLTDKEGRR